MERGHPRADGGIRGDSLGKEHTRNELWIVSPDFARMTKIHQLTSLSRASPGLEASPTGPSRTWRCLAILRLNVPRRVPLRVRDGARSPPAAAAAGPGRLGAVRDQRPAASPAMTTSMPAQTSGLGARPPVTTPVTAAET